MLTESEKIRIEHFRDWYIRNEKKYEEVSKYVEKKIGCYLEQQKLNVASSCARAKTVDSVYKKAKKVQKNGEQYVLKYSNPQKEIMDFAGVRIVVYLASEMKIVADAVENLFEGSILYNDSENKLDLLGNDKVGYLSIHYVVTINSNEKQYLHLNGLKCEIQIRTVLQDAWAQIFHDRVYKGHDESDDEHYIIRKTNLLSGSLELIDNQIDEIVRYFDSRNGNLDKKSYQQLLNKTISENSLSEYCNVLLNGRVEKFYSYNQVRKLLEAVGISTLRELDYCVNEGFIKELRSTNIVLTIDRLIRYILFVNDYEKLFSNIDSTQSFVIEKQVYDLLNQFVDMTIICQEYKNLKIEKENDDV